MIRIRLSESAKPGHYRNVCIIFSAILVVIAFILPSEIVAQDEWFREDILWPRELHRVWGNCLCLDADGFLRVVFGSNRLYYANRDESGWHEELVDPAEGVGEYASLALDQDGKPHVVYRDIRNRDLKYAYRDDQGWHVIVVDSEGDVGAYASLDIGSNGKPHIAYYDETNSRLKYATREEGGWHLQVVDDAGNVGLYGSLALDQQADPCIAYYDAANGNLKYASMDGGVWICESIDSQGNVGSHTALTIDPNGSPHISYANESDNVLCYAVRTETGWQIEQVTDTSFWSINCTSIDIDADGHAGIAYSSDCIHYAARADTGWIVNDFWGYGSGPYTQNGISLSEGEAGIHHFMFIGVTVSEISESYALYYATLDDQTSDFSTEGIATEGGVGLFSSFALDSADNLHFSCTGAGITRYPLTYVFRDDAGWRVENVPGTRDVWKATALCLDSSDTPHIAFLNGFSSSSGYCLKYACREGGTWEVQTIFPSGVTGTGISVALDETGKPHVGYANGLRIMIAHPSDSSWVSETVDSAVSSCCSPSIVFDPAGILHASYSVDLELHYARREETGWHTEYVDSGGISSVAIDQFSKPQIAYSSSEGRLRYAARSGSGWQSETVDQVDWNANEHLGNSVSLKLDSDDIPSVAYSYIRMGQLPEQRTTRIRFATIDRWQWIVENVAFSAEGATLSLDVDDRPHVCYTITSLYGQNKLQYAHRSPTAIDESIPVPAIPIVLEVRGPIPSSNVSEFSLHIRRPAYCTLTIHDFLARRMRLLYTGVISEGTHHLIWDGLDDRGMRVPSGTYICSAEAGGARVSKRVVLIR